MTDCGVSTANIGKAPWKKPQSGNGVTLFLLVFLAGGDVHNGRQRRNRNPISCMRIYASAWHHFSLRALVEYVPNATDVHDADLGRYVAWLWHGRL